jgi:hypothetical protein
LQFDYNGQQVSAVTSIPDKPISFSALASSVTIPSFDGGGFPTVPDPIWLTWDNPSSDYHLLVVKSLEQIRWL